MRILILGGTRFLGQQVAKALAFAGHDLTLLSRRSSFAPVGAKLICAERALGLAMLKGSHFDLVLDFICYDNEDLYQLATSIVAKYYVLVSSTWLPRLWSGSRADELPSGTLFPVKHLPGITWSYLYGKLRAEQGLAELRQTGCKAISLRLPIMLGDGDHTGRMNFYRYRLIDGGPLIAVDGGQNYAQIAVMEDLAQAIVRWITVTDIDCFRIWEALPGEGCSVRSIIEMMAAAAGVTATLFDVSSAELAKDFPTFLKAEPFWRESALPLTEANIFAAVDMVPAVFGLASGAPVPATDKMISLRLEELRFLAKRHAD